MGKYSIYIIIISALLYASLDAQNILVLESKKNLAKQVDELIYKNGLEYLTNKEKIFENKIEEINSKIDSLKKNLTPDSTQNKITDKVMSGVQNLELNTKELTQLILKVQNDLNNEKIEIEIKDLEKKRDKYKADLKNLKEILSYKNNLYIKSTIPVFIEPLLSNLSEVDFKVESKTKENIADILRSYFVKPDLIETLKLNEYYDVLADTLFKYSQKQYKSQISSQLSISSVFNLANGTDLSIQPSIKAKGMYKIGRSALIQANINSTVTGGIGDGKYVSTTNLLIREANKISFDVSLDYLAFSNLGLYGKGCFSIKELSDTSSSNESAAETINLINNLGLINASIGIDYILISQNFSFYAGVTYTEILTQKENFRKFYYGIEDPVIRHLIPEAGFRVMLSEGIYADLNLLFPTKGFQELMGNNDKVIPLLRLSLEKL